MTWVQKKAPFLSHNISPWKCSHFHNCGLVTFWKYCLRFVQICNGKRTALVLLWLLCGSLPKQQECVSDTWIYFSDWSSWLLNVEGRVLHSSVSLLPLGFDVCFHVFLSPMICLVPDSRVLKSSGIYFFVLKAGCTVNSYFDVYSLVCQSFFCHWLFSLLVDFWFFSTCATTPHQVSTSAFVEINILTDVLSVAFWSNFECCNNLPVRLIHLAHGLCSLVKGIVQSKL